MPRSLGIAWLTTLSLDAPLVCIAWQGAISIEYGLSIEWHHRFLVFAAVWLGYSADRWLDAWRHKANVSRRHRFYRDRRWLLSSTWLIVLATSLTIALLSLANVELQRGFLLALLSIAFTSIIQFARFRAYQSLFKSILTAILVTASILLFASPTKENDRLAACLLLGSLFISNCCLIHFWDRTIDALQEPNLDRDRRLKSLGLAVSLCCISIVCFRHSPLALPTLVCLALLSLLHIFKRRLTGDDRRTLADVCLILPLAPAIWL